MIEYPFNEVNGMMAPGDRNTLRRFSEICNSVRGEYAEVGSYEGLSSLCIASGMSVGKLLFCFDFFEDKKLEQFRANVLAAQMDDRILAMRGNFKDFRFQNFVANTKFAFVFIDHDHSLDNTFFAYISFRPRISSGGIMAFHDYRHPDYMEPTAFLDSIPLKRVSEDSILAFQIP